MPLRNRFKRLYNAVKEVVSDIRTRESREDAAKKIGDRMMAKLIELQPVPTLNRGYDPWRSRPEHTAISKGWRGPAITIPERGSTQVAISNVSEHIEVQRFGRLADKGPTLGRQSFWLGLGEAKHPEIWKRLFKRTRAGHDPIITLHKTQRTSAMQPWGGSDFVERAANAERVTMRTIVTKMGHTILFTPLKREL